MFLTRLLKFLLHYSAFFVLVMVLLFHHPVHDDMSDQTLVRIFYGTTKLVKYMGDIAELAGRNRWPIERSGYDFLSHVMSLPLEEGITEELFVFNGVSVTVYQPQDTRASAKRPALVYLHGGGFTFGSSDTHKKIADVLAKRLQTVVISVNYRLTPEFPYPAQLNDVLSVLDYLKQHAKTLGIDTNNVGIAGDSAGGALSAATALKLRDEPRGIKLKYQVLIYPYVQGLTVDLPSHHVNEWHVHHMLSQKTISEVTAMYIGADIKLSAVVIAGNHTSAELWQEYGHLVHPRQLPPEYIPENYKLSHFGTHRLDVKNHGISQKAMSILKDPYAFPLMARSLKDLPPAFVLTCQLDPLRDEGLLYVQRLKKDGVRVEHYHDKRGFHGMIAYSSGMFVLQEAVAVVDAIVKFVELMRSS